MIWREIWVKPFSPLPYAAAAAAQGSFRIQHDLLEMRISTYVCIATELRIVKRGNDLAKSSLVKPELPFFSSSFWHFMSHFNAIPAAIYLLLPIVYLVQWYRIMNEWYFLSSEVPLLIMQLVKTGRKKKAKEEKKILCRLISTTRHTRVLASV